MNVTVRTVKYESDALAALAPTLAVPLRGPELGAYPAAFTRAALAPPRGLHAVLLFRPERFET